MPLSPSGNNILNLEQILASRIPQPSTPPLARGPDDIVDKYTTPNSNKRTRDVEDDYDYDDGWIDDGSVEDGDEEMIDEEEGEGGKGDFFVVRGELSEGGLLKEVKRLKRELDGEGKGVDVGIVSGSGGENKEVVEGKNEGDGKSAVGKSDGEDVGKSSVGKIGGKSGARRGSSASKLPKDVADKIERLRQLCVELFDGRKPRLDRSEVQAALHEVFTSARNAGVAKLHSDIGQDNRRIAIDDAVWSELSTFLRTTRAHLEPLGHALHWSEESERAKERAEEKLERLRTVAQEMKGRIIWGEFLEDAVLDWYEGRVDVLKARNQLSSRSNKVAKMLGKWITSMKADVFGDVEIVDKDIGEAITRAEGRKKAKIKREKDERKKEKEKEKARKKEEKERAEKEKLKEKQKDQQQEQGSKEKDTKSVKKPVKKKATASEILGRALGKTFHSGKKDGGLIIGRALGGGKGGSKTGTPSKGNKGNGGKAGGGQTPKGKDKSTTKADSIGKSAKGAGETNKTPAAVPGNGLKKNSKQVESKPSTKKNNSSTTAPKTIGKMETQGNTGKASSSESAETKKRRIVPEVIELR